MSAAPRIFIFGAGFSGRAFAQAVRGEAGALWGTTRDAGKFPELITAGLTPLVFDGSVLSAEVREALATTTHLVVSAGPAETGDPVLDAAGPTIRDAMPALRHIAYLSTVGVYGNHNGAWVTETSDCRPSQQRSEARLAAEAGWLALGAERNVPVAVLRLSGIYGPSRNALANLSEGTARRIVKPGQVFNRIHTDDIAGALRHLGARDLDGIWNVSDDEPSPPQDVVSFAAQLMGVEPPPEVPFEAAGLSPMGRSFYGDVKRVSNAKLKESGYRFRHPTYREALSAMWRDGRWRSVDPESLQKRAPD